MTKVGKQFQQEGLFPESESGIKGSPASQSPEEFRDDPQTVFHASYRKFPTRNSPYMSGSSFAGMHAGTYQAAAERAEAFGAFYNTDPGYRRADGVREGASPKVVFHPLSLKGSEAPKPGESGSVTNPVSDEEGNHHESVNGRETKPLIYKNNAEDIGSLSVVWGKRPRNIQQSDWVQDAVRNNQNEGRRPDYGVHPRTYEMHTKGSLDNYDQKTHIEARKMVTSKGDEFHAHDGGFFPYEVREDGQMRLASREEVHQIAPLARLTGDTAFNDPYYDRRPASGVAQRINVARTITHLQDKTAVSPIWPSFGRSKNERISDLGDLRRGQQFGGQHG